MASTFARGLSPDFIKKLNAEAQKGGWWTDVLADPDLFIGVRQEYLDVYWVGQRLFHVSPGSSGLKVTTHPKYLMDPDLKNPVRLSSDGEFSTGELKEAGFISKYEGKDTLKKLKKAAQYFSGLEKTGCHRIVMQNPQVIDCEIAFAEPSSSEPEPEPGPDFIEETETFLESTPPTLDRRGVRVDLASVECDGGSVRLVFWEAKNFSNPELRANGSPLVCGQIQRYKQRLMSDRHAIEASYVKVSGNLKSIAGMGKRQLSPVILQVAEGRTLTLTDDPAVGLLIFGFDRGQRNEERWNTIHLPKLEREIGKDRVKSQGNVGGLRLP
jgi:hypothetical protein